MGAFFAPLLAALRWIGLTAFTGAGGAAVGTAVASGVAVFVTRLGVGLVTFTVIYSATSAMIAYAVSELGQSPALALMQQTGVITGINIVLSSMQAVLAIRVAKVGFAKVGA